MEGKCHICGTHGKLTFEHVPPKSAFNRRPALLARFEDMVAAGTIEELEGVKGKDRLPRGMGGYSLCERCNNNTGGWYGRAYVDWVYQGMLLCEKARIAPSITLPLLVYPARVIKQIVAMFFSINSAGFNEAQPDLVRFVLNQSEKYVPDEVRVFAALNSSPRVRMSGVSARMNIARPGGDICAFSEVCYPPFTYVLTLNSRCPDDRLVDITYFRHCGYEEEKCVGLRLPILPVFTWFPADYRDKDSIQNIVQK